MIKMTCDHCGNLVQESVPGGVRLKMARKVLVFHLCHRCQQLLQGDIHKFVKGQWKEEG